MSDDIVGRLRYEYGFGDRLEAADEILRLRAENEKLRESLEYYKNKDAKNGRDISNLVSKKETYRAENEKLRAALKPFAFAKVDRTFPKMPTFSITFEDKDGDPFENAAAAIRDTGD